MSLAAPWLLGLIALALPILWAFLARRRAPKRVVGSVLLLRAAAAKARARIIAPQIRHPVSLALTLLALLAITFGLSGPRCGESAGGRTLVVLDASGVMQRDSTAGGAVYDAAMRDLGLLLDSIGPTESVALIEAGPVPRVTVGVTRDVARVQTAARGARVAGRADLARAVRLADALCNDPNADGILIVSGGSAATLPATTCPVSRVRVAEALPNAGIAVLAARRADGLGLLEVVVGIAGDLPRDVPVEIAIRVDGRLVDTVALDLPAGGTAWSVRRLDVAGEIVEAELLDLEDGNRADNVAVAVRPADAALRVGLVTNSPSGFVATALRLHPEVSLQVVAPADSESLAGRDLVVLEAAAAVPSSGSVVALGADAARAAGVPSGDPIAAPVLTRWAFDDPLLRYVDLDDLVIRKARRLVPPAGATSLVEAAGLPIVVVGRVREQRVLATGFSPGDSDLVLRVDFLHLIANLVEWGADRTDEPDAPELGRVWVGAAVDDRLVARTGSTPGWAVLGRTGVHDIVAADGKVRGRIAPMPAGVGSVAGVSGPSLDAVPVAAAGGAVGWPWWLWAVLAALIFALAETAWTGGLWWAARVLGRDS